MTGPLPLPRPRAPTPLAESILVTPCDPCFLRVPGAACFEPPLRGAGSRTAGRTGAATPRRPPPSWRCVAVAIDSHSHSRCHRGRSDFEEESESESEEESGDDDEARQKVYYRCAPLLAQAPAPALFHSAPHAAAVRFSHLLEFCG